MLATLPGDAQNATLLPCTCNAYAVSCSELILHVAHLSPLLLHDMAVLLRSSAYWKWVTFLNDDHRKNK